MKLRIRLQKFDTPYAGYGRPGATISGAPAVVMATRPATDAEGQPRLVLADPFTARPILFPDFGAAASLAGAVLDTNPHVVAQARCLSPETLGPKGTVWTKAQYAVSVAARQGGM